MCAAILRIKGDVGLAASKKNAAIQDIRTYNITSFCKQKTKKKSPLSCRKPNTHAQNIKPALLSLFLSSLTTPS